METLQKIQKRVENSFEEAVKSSQSGSLSALGQAATSRDSLKDQSPQKSIEFDAGMLDATVLRTRERTIEDLRKENESLLAEGTRLGRRLGTVEEKHRERLREIDSMTREKKLLESRLQTAEEAAGRASSLQEQLTRAENNLKQELERKSRLQGEAISAESKARLSTISEELHGLQEERRGLIASNRMLEAESERLRLQFTERISALEADMSALKRYTVELEDRLQPGLDIAESPAVLANFAGPLGSFGPYATQDETDALKCRNEELTLRVRELESAIDEKEYTIRSLTAKISDLTQRAPNLEQIVSTKNLRISELERKLEVVENLRKGLSESLVSEVSSRDQSTSKELIDLRSECSALRLRVRELEQRVPITSSVTDGAALDAAISRKFEMALQAIGKLQDDLHLSQQREVRLQELLAAQRLGSPL